MGGLSCLFDPGACIQSGFHNMLTAIPWWAWVIIALVLIGVVWKFAGWPGLVALALAVGYIGGRRNWTPFPAENVDGPDAEPPPKRRVVKRKPKTLEDLFRDGLK